MYQTQCILFNEENGGDWLAAQIALEPLLIYSGK